MRGHPFGICVQSSGAGGCQPRSPSLESDAECRRGLDQSMAAVAQHPRRTRTSSGLLPFLDQEQHDAVGVAAREFREDDYSTRSVRGARRLIVLTPSDSDCLTPRNMAQAYYEKAAADFRVVDLDKIRYQEHRCILLSIKQAVTLELIFGQLISLVRFVLSNEQRWSSSGKLEKTSDGRIVKREGYRLS